MLKSKLSKTSVKSAEILAAVVLTLLLAAGCKNAKLVDIDLSESKTSGIQGMQEEISFPADKPQELFIDAEKCDITIISQDRNEVKITIKAINESEDKLLQNKKIIGRIFEIKQIGNKISFQPRALKTLRKDNTRYAVEVTAPNNTGCLQIMADDGKLTINSDLRCDLTLEAGACNVQIDRLVGNLKAKVAQGDFCVSSGKLSSAECLTGNGNISIRTELEEDGNYLFETDMGNISLQLPAAQKLKIETAGIVELNQFIKEDTGITVLVKSRMGRIIIRKTTN